MIGKNRKNLQLLKNRIDITIVNQTLLEKAYIILSKVNNIDYIPNNHIYIDYQKIEVDTYECYSKKMDKKIVFHFDKMNNKNFNLIVKYPNKEENIEVYNDKKNTLVSIQKKLYNATTYQCFSKYTNNKLKNVTESINLDFEDPNLKKVTKMRLLNTKGDKVVTIYYDRKPIMAKYYNIDFLNSNLEYNNINNLSNYEYKEKLLFEKEYVDCKDELNKKVLVRK